MNLFQVATAMNGVLDRLIEHQDVLGRLLDDQVLGPLGEVFLLAAVVERATSPLDLDLAGIRV